jgi:hypothetical protein
VLQDSQRLGHLDLEASEMAIGGAMHQVGDVLLEKLLNSDGKGHRGAHVDCGHGHAAEFVGYRGKQVLIGSGTVTGLSTGSPFTFQVPLVTNTGGTFNASGGNISVVDVAVTGGTLLDGAGVLTLSHNYSQLGTGVLDVQIGGTEAGAEYSRLSVTGPVVLNGTLNIALIGGFSPQLSQSFTILHSPSGVTCTFSTVNGESIDS